MSKLEQYRVCDGYGLCCEKRGQFRASGVKNGPCRYWLAVPGSDKNCELMVKPELQKELSEEERKRFNEICVGWPENYPDANPACCWRKVKCPLTS